MTTAEIQAAADSFVAYRDRHHLATEHAWRLWTSARRVTPHDAERIHEAAMEVLFARGDTTEPPPMAA